MRFINDGNKVSRGETEGANEYEVREKWQSDMSLISEG